MLKGIGEQLVHDQPARNRPGEFQLDVLCADNHPYSIRVYAIERKQVLRKAAADVASPDFII